MTVSNQGRYGQKQDISREMERHGEQRLVHVCTPKHMKSELIRHFELL